MMKHFRILALILAMLTLLSAFVACDNKPEETKAETTASNSGEGSGEETTKEPEKVVDVEKKNYDDDFFLSILPDVNPMDYYWADPEKTESSAMYEALYARQLKVFEHLGVTITATSAGNHQTYIEPFKNAVKTMDGSRDTLITHVNTGVPGLVSEMYLQDFGQMPGIDLEADHWNHDFMDALSVSTNKGDYYYLGFSNFNILYTHVIAFNKTMMEQKTSGILDKSVYQLVRDYEWTLDKMISLAQLVSEDPSQDGKTDDDTYGLTGTQWVPWIGFLHASNINYVERDVESGEYRIALMNDTYKERTSALVTKLKDFSASACAYLNFQTSAATPVPLTSNRALMQLASTYGLVSFLDSEVTFGVLPYPMYDENQKNVGYRSLQWGGYLCIPSYLRNKEMVGDTLEVLSFYSDDVMVTFYEKMLGKQAADVPDDAEMLNIIWDSVCTDFGQTYSENCGGTLYIMPYVTWPGEGGKDLASYVAGLDKSGNKAIRKFMNTVEKNIENQKKPS